MNVSNVNGLLSIDWDEPINILGILTYTVTGYVDGVQYLSRTTTSRVSSLIMTGLDYGTTYTFDVRANGANGEIGDPSNYSDAIVFTNVFVVGTTTGVNATAGDTFATVNWTAPITSGNVIDYTVISDPVTTTKTTLNSQTEINFTGLTPGTPYTFAVKANLAGIDVPTGSFSSYSTNSVTPLGKPTSATATSGYLRAKVTWNIPSIRTGILGYKVYSTPATPEPGTITGATSTSLYMTGLSNSLTDTYTFKVRAYGASGILGPESDPTTATPGNIPQPGPPTDVIVQAGANIFHVRWSAPIGTNNISKYLVEWYKSSDNTLSGSQSLDGTERSLIYPPGQSLATSYYFKIYTFVDPDFYGSVAVQSDQITVPFSGTPNTPTGFVVIKTDGVPIASWNEPNAISGQSVIGYTIYTFKNDSTTPLSSTPVSLNSSPYTIFGLTPGTYRFSVQSRTSSTVSVITALTNSLTMP